MWNFNLYNDNIYIYINADGFSGKFFKTTH